MKKIAIIVRSAQTGGVENHVHDILSHCRHNGYEAVLISLANVPVARKFKDLGIDIVKLNDRMWMSKRSVSNIIPLIRALRKIDPDIVHVHGARPIFIGSIAARLAGISNVVATLHGSVKLMAFDKASGKHDTKKLLISKFIHVVGLFLSKRVIIDANMLRNEIIDACAGYPGSQKKILDKTQTIHIGIDDLTSQKNYDCEKLKDKLGISNNHLVVGTIGRLDEPLKGVGFLLSAVQRLVQEGLDIVLLVVGNGESKEALVKKSVTLGISKNVKFLGYWEDLSEIYSILDIFTLPSLSEGFPIVNLEAMANGVPVITTNVGGAAEGVGDRETGVVIEPGSDVAIAGAIKELYADEKKRVEMGEKGRQRVVNHFGKSDMIRKIFDTYHDVINKKI